MSRGESVTSGLAISGIGVAMILMGFQPWWAGGIATLGAVIALVAIFQPKPETPESRTRKRLLRVAQAALDLSASANSDEEFVESFYDWQTETNALRDFILAHYGLRERDQLGRELYRRDEAVDFAAVMRELAARVE